MVNDVNKLVRKASSGIGEESLEAVMEMRMLSKLVSVFNKISHPLHDMLVEIRNISSQGLIPPRCSSKQHEWTRRLLRFILASKLDFIITFSLI